MNIVVLAGKLHAYGGIETHLFHFCEAMADLANITLIITSKDYKASSQQQLIRHGVRIIEFNCRGKFRGGVQYFSCVWWLIRRKVCECILYSNGTSDFAWLANVALRPRLWIHHHHGDITPAIVHDFSGPYKAVIRNADWVIACTPGQARLLGDVFHRPDRSVFLPYLKAEKATAVLRETSKSDTDMVVGFFGRLRESKGVLTLIDLAPWFVEQRIVCRLHGDNCENLISRNLPPGIIWKGPYDSSCELDELLRGVDVVVLPTLFAEGLPIVMSEALSRGVPVVAFPGGGLREMQGFHPGVLIVQPNPESLKVGLLEMRKRLENSGLRSSIAEKYREELSNDKTLEWWTQRLRNPGSLKNCRE